MQNWRELTYEFDITEASNILEERNIQCHSVRDV